MIRSTCPYCGVGCGVILSPAGHGLSVKGDPDHPANRGRLCSKGTALGETVLDLRNPAAVLAALRALGFDLPDTRGWRLERWREGSAAIDALLRWRKAERLARTYDALEERIGELRAREELDAVRPELDGRQIGEILGIAPGPLLGRAYKYLLAVRLGEPRHHRGEVRHHQRADVRAVGVAEEHQGQRSVRAVGE